MTIHKTIHPSDDKGSMGQEKKEEEDQPAFRIASIKGLEDYNKNSKERLIPAATNINGNIRPNGKATKTKEIEMERKTTVCLLQRDKATRLHTRRPGHD